MGEGPINQEAVCGVTLGSRLSITQLSSPSGPPLVISALPIVPAAPHSQPSVTLCCRITIPKMYSRIPTRRRESFNSTPLPSPYLYCTACSARPVRWVWSR